MPTYATAGNEILAALPHYNYFATEQYIIYTVARDDKEKFLLF